MIVESEQSPEENKSEQDSDSVLSGLKIVQIKNSDEKLFYCEKCNSYGDASNITEHLKLHNTLIKLENMEENALIDANKETFIKDFFASQETNQEQSFVYEMQQEDSVEEDPENPDLSNENGLDCESKIQMSVIMSENAKEEDLFVIDNECAEVNQEDVFVAIVYQCQECNEAFASMEKLKEHVEEQQHGTIDDKLFCNLCGFCADNKALFDEHIETEHATYACEFCERTFKSAVSRSRHTTSHLKDVDTLECGICESNFTSKDELLAHKKVHISTDGRYICPTCDITCMNEKYLKSHIYNAHNSGHDFPCEMCHKTFKRKSNRWSHHSNHVYDFPCKYCCNSYNSKFSLECHMASHNSTEKTTTGVINCEFQDCDEMFHSKFQYFNHKKKHLNVVEYKCSTCQKFFKSESILKNHKKIHESGTVCPICNKGFANQKTLKEHMRLHTGELPFSCRVCGQKFRCQSFLAVHKTTHTGERNYKCRFCQQAFSRSSYLKEHLRTHTHDKPFVCKYCNKGYAQANVLSKHLTTMHRRCSICKEIIGDKMKLQVHLWKQHPHKETKGDDEMFILTETEPMLIGEETVVGF